MSAQTVWVAGVVMGCVLACGVPARAGPEPTTQTSQPAVPVPAGAAAVVNGQAISDKDLTDLLVERYGKPAVQQLVVMTLIKQELTRRALTVTDAEIDALLAERIAQGGGPAAFNERLRAFGASVAYVKKHEVARDIALRKLTEKDVTVTDQDVERAFEGKYGEQRQVRRIVVDDPRIAADVQKQIQAGADFAEVARKQSADPLAQSGGLLQPIGRRSQEREDQALEDIIFKLKVGETSGVVGVRNRFYLVKLEAIIPARTDVKFDDVKAKLREEVRQQRTVLAAQRLLSDLGKKAQIGLRPDLTGS